MLFKFQFFIITVFFFFVSVSSYGRGPHVYICKKPLPDVVKELRGQGYENQKIKDYITSDSLEVTKELAKKYFGIEWIEGDYSVFDPNYKFPDLIITFVGGGQYYGLFTLDEIQPKQAIVQYTGHIKTKTKIGESIGEYGLISNADIKNNLYFIDAKNAGNASRFANYFPSIETLERYGYESKINIATDNAEFIFAKNVGPNVAFIFSKKIIPQFSQIGVEYSEDFGYEGSSDNVPVVDVYTTEGNIIPTSEYKLRNLGLRFVDKKAGLFFINFISFDDVSQYFKKQQREKDNVVVNIVEDISIAVEQKIWDEAFKRSSQRNRISIPCVDGELAKIVK